MGSAAEQPWGRAGAPFDRGGACGIAEAVAGARGCGTEPALSLSKGAPACDTVCKANALLARELHSSQGRSLGRHSSSGGKLGILGMSVRFSVSDAHCPHECDDEEGNAEHSDGGKSHDCRHIREALQSTPTRPH